MAEGYAGEGKALDLKKLLIAYIRSIWLIGLVACIAFIAVTFYVENTPNLYTASATMYVYISNPNQVNYQYTSQSDLNTAARLMQTYMVVIRSNKVMDAVAERLGPQYNAKYIASTLSIGSVAQTEVMRVGSTTPDPQLSMEICNAVAEFAPPEIIRVVNAGSVEVIDYASLPRFADDKRMMEKSLLGALLGAMLVCGLVTVRVMFDDHITSKKDLTEHFEIPVLARIPDLKRGFLANRDLRKKRKNALRKSRNLYAKQLRPSSRSKRRFRQAMNRVNNLLIGSDSLPLVVETYKMLRANLSVAMDGTDSNVVLISSSIPSEGKSTVSANLSIVLAQAYERVLLIEADMRKPVQSGMFGFETADHGLSTVLQGVDEFDNAVLRDVHPGMDLLPSGLPQMNPSELLGSNNMKSLLSRLRSEYRFIIIDTPPANIVADLLSLSGQVAGAAIVVRHGVSTLKEVHSAVETLAFSGMKILGFVLTDMPEETRKRVYYKRYYYDSMFEGENERSLDTKETSNAEDSTSRRRRSGRSAGARVAHSKR